MLKYIVRTTLERELHSSFSQIDYELLIDKEHKVQKEFINQLESISDNDVVLMEDDIILCRDFKARIEQIINEHPNEIINFFSKPFEYYQSGYRNFSYNQCTYYPKEILKDIVNQFKVKWKHIHFSITPETYIIKYLRGKQIYTYRPCLVQHIDGYSVLKNVEMNGRRRTPYFIDYLEDLNILYKDAEQHIEELTDYMNKSFKEI